MNITTSKWLAIVAVAFVAGSFVASPELRAYAANTIGSADIIDESIQSIDIKNGEVKAADIASNAITAAKIKDGEVKAAEIATDAVGAAELQGVSKLLYGQCKADSTEASKLVSPGSQLFVHCSIAGVDSDDSAVATINGGHVCFDIIRAEPGTNDVLILMENECGTTQQLLPSGQVSIIVYDK